jgi:hypothetical protein
MKTIIALFFIVISIGCSGQSDTTLTEGNAIYGDAGFGIQSVMLDLEIGLTTPGDRKVNYALRTGFGVAEVFWAKGPTFLAGGTMVVGRKFSRFDLSAGGVLIQDSDQDKKEKYVWPLLEMGYRISPASTPLLVRIKAGTLGLGFSVGVRF